MYSRLLSAVILLTIAFIGLAGPDAQAQAAPLICVDAGHGGPDTGTSGGGVIEKELNLHVANAFGELLTQGGYGVANTRTSDVELSNTQRAEFCNSVGATILVSVHHNGSSNLDTDYTTSLYQKRVDRDLAGVISAHVAEATSGSDRGIMQFASGVLIKSDMPATISEGYFLTNPAEQAKLNADYFGYVNTEAAALYKGVIAYLGSSGGGGTDAVTVPAAPEWMSATLTSLRGPNATIELAWDNVDGEAGFRIFRSTGGNPYELIFDSLPADTTGAQERVKAGPTYQYCVAAFNEAGTSDWACSESVPTTG